MDVIDWFSHEDDANMEATWRAFAAQEIEEFSDCYEDCDSDEEARERAIKESKAHEIEMAKAVELARRRQLYGDEIIVAVFSNNSPEITEFLKEHGHGTNEGTGNDSSPKEPESATEPLVDAVAKSHEVAPSDITVTSPLSETNGEESGTALLAPTATTPALVLPYRSDTVVSATKVAEAIASIRTPLLAALTSPSNLPSDDDGGNKFSLAGPALDPETAARDLAQTYAEAGLEKHALVLPAVLLGEKAPNLTTETGAKLQSVDSGEVRNPSPPLSPKSACSDSTASSFYPTDIGHLDMIGEDAMSLHSFYLGSGHASHPDDIPEEAEADIEMKGTPLCTPTTQVQVDGAGTDPNASKSLHESPSISDLCKVSTNDSLADPNKPEGGKLYLGGWRTSAYVHVTQKRIGLIVNAALVIDILAATSHGATWLEDCQRLENEGVKFVRLPWHDTDRQRLWKDKPWDQLIEAVRAVYNALKNGHNVLVHCRKGRSRSATIVIAYLMARRGYSREEAILHVLNRRPSIAPNTYFLTQLWEFERSRELLELRVEIGLPKVVEAAREALRRRFPRSAYVTQQVNTVMHPSSDTSAAASVSSPKVTTESASNGASLADVQPLTNVEVSKPTVSP